jgi:hydrogenase-4 membrane subunit HyfE
MSEATNQLLDNLNALAAGLFLLTAFGIVAMRQVRGCLNLFIVQSLLLAASAALLGLRHQSEHLFGVALVNVISKPLIVPWLLRKTSPAEIYTRREIDQALNIPTSLLMALALAILAYFLELAIATDGLIIVFIMGVLTRAVQKHIGTTAVGTLASLKEAAAEPAARELTE